MHCARTVEELNIKSKLRKDLLTDEPFTRKDIVCLQTPLTLQVCSPLMFTRSNKT